MKDNLYAPIYQGIIMMLEDQLTRSPLGAKILNCSPSQIELADLHNNHLIIDLQINTSGDLSTNHHNKHVSYPHIYELENPAFPDNLIHDMLHYFKVLQKIQKAVEATIKENPLPTSG